jgi:hypothetical protein
MGNGDDVGAEIVKAVIAGAVNMAIPGLGSLAAAGIGKLKPEAVQAEVRVELGKAISAVGGHQDVAFYAFWKRVPAAWRQQKVSDALPSSVGFVGLLRSGEQGGSGGKGGDKQAPGTAQIADPDRLDLARMADAFLAASSAQGEVPGSWQDNFARLLAVAATAGLEEGSGEAPRWRKLLDPHDSGARLGAAEVAEWSILVTRVFAARMESNQKLRPVVLELRQQDRDAFQRAMLWRLDEQRRALQAIAGVFTLVAVALGIDARLL